MRTAVTLLMLVVLSACSDSTVTTDAPLSIKVTSSAIVDGRPIPQRFSCRGDNVSPPLQWSGVPADAKEIALVVDDPDAPRGTFTHWILFGLAPAVSELSEGETPTGAKQAKNSAGEAAYTGPCPPSGTHHYRFTVYGLRDRLALDDGADTDKALAEIGKKALARGRLTGTFTSG